MIVARRPKCNRAAQHDAPRAGLRVSHCGRRSPSRRRGGIVELAMAAPPQIPVLDFSPFRSGDPGGKQRVAAEIARACETVGFFYLSGHGVPQATIDAMWEASKRFFALPEAAKLDPDLQITLMRNRGYQPLRSRLYGGTGAPDLNEGFKYQRELPADDPDVLAGNRVLGQNRWPKELPLEWRKVLLDYFDAVEDLGRALLGGFALALELPEDWFHRFYRKPLTQVTLLHYPPQPASDPADHYGIRPHTDQTSFTILMQDSTGGFQLRYRDEWIDAPPLEGTYLINIGDWMARWTNDRFASTMHRAYNRRGLERYSTPYFAIPDYEAVVECLPTCHGPGNPPKYPPQKVGDSVRKRFSSNWKDGKT